MDKQQFLDLFFELADWYRKEDPSPRVVKVYWSALKHLPIEALDLAVDAAIASHKFMPTPAELLALVAPSGEEKALEQWTTIHSLACRGDVDTTGLDEEAIAALEKLTGKTPIAAIRALGQFDSFQTAKWESQFKRLYTAATQRAPMEAIAPASQAMLQGAE